MTFVLFWNCALADFTPSIKKAEHSGEISWSYYFDDSSTLLVTKDKAVEISNDDGATWNPVPELADIFISDIMVDKVVKERAFAFSSGSTHFVTNDRGQTWSKFELNVSEDKDAFVQVHLSHHVENPNMVIFNVEACLRRFIFEKCKTASFYTKDNCKTTPKLLVEKGSCLFAYSEKDFKSDIHKDTIICLKNSVNSFDHITKSELLTSSDFFRTQNQIEHDALKSGRIVSIRAVSAFITVLIQSDKFNDKSEVRLMVSRDGKSFELSDLDVKMEYGGVGFLESSPLSIFLTLMKPKSLSFGESTLYSSDSTGLKFTPLIEHMQPYSITKSQYVDGVWFTNIEGESEGLVSTPFGKESIYVTSKVSIDDGLTWDLLELTDDPKCNIKDGCSLQIMNMANIQENNKFVTGPTANILVTVGSPGKGRIDMKKLGTYLSSDGGLTWRMISAEPTMFSFADQGNIIVCVPFSYSKQSTTDTFYYSIDQGQTFQHLNFDTEIEPVLLVTTLDGSGTKFVLLGMSKKSKMISYAVDFDQAFDGKVCGTDDFEVVSARVPTGGTEPKCIRGYKESFNRRKADAKCLVKTLFEDVKVNEEPCECTAADFECALYFDLSEKNACVPNLKKIDEYCKLQKSSKVTLPHQQLKAGNLCTFNKKKESDFIAQSDFDCKKLDVPSDDPANTGKIEVGLTEVPGMLLQYSYVNSGEGIADNILVNTDKHYAYASNDGGKSFVKIPIGERTESFYVGEVPGSVVMCSESSVYFSVDGGNFFVKYKAPGPPSSYGAISFHPTQAQKYIYYSGDSCGSYSGSGCKTYYTTDGGESFQELIDDSGRCAYVNEVFGQLTDMIFCAVANGNDRKLVSTSNYFKDTKTIYENIVDFALRSKFVFVAAISEDRKELQAKVTLDGDIFADADFPSDFKVDAQTGYTILDSGTQSLFLHVTTSKIPGQEIGTILKSNSNGTFYVSALPNVNRNAQGYVDFDKIDIIEGVLMANVVANPNSKEEKKLQTLITYNEASKWHFLAPPAVDSENKKYLCNGRPLSQCALHLQGFTERPDFRDTFLSQSAIGFLIGVGNVGEFLGSSDMATFISTDGGITWKEIRKGKYMWEYGDKGTILLLVDAENATNEVVYSTDDGQTWSTYEFTENPIQVWDLATVPTDTERKFVIFAGEDKKLKQDTKIFSIDFTHYFSRQCQLDLDNPLDDDFDYWTPRHPESADNCLFGRETKYLRRTPGHNDCFIGLAPLDQGSKVVRNCTCTRRDYECDYNYYADNDGTCKLVPGLSPQDRLAQMCSKEGTFQYFEPTGYRKIPTSSCVGGKSLDSWNSRACPGHEKEFNEFYGKTMGFGTWIIVVVLPALIFVIAVWYVYEKGIRRNGGFERLGQIRLDDDDDFSPIEDNSVDVVVNKIVKGGIIAVAGVIAVVKTIRKIDKKFMEGVTGALFGRRPSGRSYVRVPDDEDELFGNFEENYEDEMESGTDFNFDVQLDPEIFEDFQEEPGADSRLFDITDEDAGAHDAEPTMK